MTPGERRERLKRIVREAAECFTPLSTGRQERFVIKRAVDEIEALFDMKEDDRGKRDQAAG